MNKSIKVIPFPDIPNAYVVISAIRTERGNRVAKRMTFLYGNKKEGIAAEWEPDYGPITVIRSVKEGAPRSMPHYFFEFFNGNGDWTQLGVEQSGINEAFLAGDYDELFNILRHYVKGTLND